MLEMLHWRLDGFIYFSLTGLFFLFITPTTPTTPSDYALDYYEYGTPKPAIRRNQLARTPDVPILR